MSKDSILKSKSKEFALHIIHLYNYLYGHKEFVLSKQVLRSGTSIGANITEAFYAQSTPDFLSKLGIARKEAGETIYWIELLQEAQYIECSEAESLLNECHELLRMLSSSILTLKQKLSQNNP
ncbi:MAG: four helix bundle protein [Muribaculaceae bacterium]|nr:four helix bundle protein [Muribaculaceae bacterium]